jgi:hypothetical protein
VAGLLVELGRGLVFAAFLVGGGATVLETGDEILALVDDTARGQLAKILGRAGQANTN